MEDTRQQLTLFVKGEQFAAIEDIRSRYNPIQHAIIAAHITLCREDELMDWQKIAQNLKQLGAITLTLGLDRPERFAEGKGVLMRVNSGQIEFQQLRNEILKGVFDTPRIHHAHLTLMHPRNSTCTPEIFKQIRETSLPRRLTFDSIYRIEQRNGKAWKIKEAYPDK